ncbi:hypothetical protein CPC16_005300 [Podila verticillata]|nr:hypothetical protein CPC16_005300 [Podila verticillata]
MSPSNSKRSAYARPNHIANPFEDDSNKNNIVIVNSDIMILPGQHESQTEEEYDDNDDTSSSGAQSSHDNPSPHPLSSKSSHHAPEGTVMFRPVSRPNTGISETAPVSHSASGVRQLHAPSDLRQQDLEMKERALTKSRVPTATIAATIARTSSSSQDGRAVRTSPLTSPTRTKHTINSINNNSKNNNISSNTHLNPISNHEQGRHINGTEKSDSSIPATNMRELINNRQLGHDQGGTTTSASASATLGAGALNDERGRSSRQENSHPTRAQSRTRHGNSARSRDIGNSNTNFDNIANNNKSSKYNPHGSLISQHNLPPSTTIKPLSFFGRFSKQTESRKKRDSLQLLQQTQPRPLTQPGSTTPSEMNSTTGSKNELVLDHHLKNEKVHEKGGLGPRATTGLCLHGQRSRKRGVPGKDGEEPETDMFNFVDIMLNMPEEPTWRLVIIKLLKVLAVMTISYFTLMALYFAAEFQSDDHMKNFEVLVVDLDFGMVGAQYSNFANILSNQTSQLHWVVQPKDRFQTFDQVKAQVESGAYWGAVVIMPNTSSTLNKMLSTPLKDFDPSGAFAFVYDGGRDPLVVKPYIVANMYTSFLQFSKLFNPMWIRFSIGLYTQQGVNITNLYDAPQVLGTPVAFTEYDLHPTTASIITSATSVAYIWIFLVAGGSTYLVANMIQPLTKHSSVPRTMMSLLFPLLLFLATLSMAYSILLLSFGVPFKDGASQFLSLFGGMLLLQLAVSSMVLFLIFLIPVVYIPTITITFVILNVIAVFNPVELMPKFYRWVYAMPFLNAVQIARYVLMGSYNRLHFNLPILGVWILVPWVMLPFAIARQKRLAREGMLRALEEEQFQLQQLRLHQLQLKDSVISAVEEDGDSNEETVRQDRAKLRKAKREESTRSRSQDIARAGRRVPRQSATLARGRHDIVHAPSDEDDDVSEGDFRGHHQNSAHHTSHPNTTSIHQELPNVPYLHFYQPPSTAMATPAPTAPYVLPPFHQNANSTSPSPMNVSLTAPTQSQVFNTRSSHSNRVDVPARNSISRCQQRYSSYADDSIPDEVK